MKKVPLVIDEHGVEHKLWYLVRRCSADYQPFIRAQLALLANPETYASAAKTLIWMNADFHAVDQANFRTLASLTQISKMAEQNIRDSHSSRRKCTMSNCTQGKMPENITDKQQEVVDGLSLNDIGTIMKKFPRRYKQLLSTEEVNFYLKNKAKR